MDERRYTPRAHLDEGGDRYTNRAALLSSSQEHCDRITFHVLVSLMPSSPTSRTEFLQEGDTEMEGVLPWGSQEPSWCQQTSGGQPTGLVLDCGHCILRPQRKGYNLPPDSTLLQNSFFPTFQAPSDSPAGAKCEEGGVPTEV